MKNERPRVTRRRVDRLTRHAARQGLLFNALLFTVLHVSPAAAQGIGPGAVELWLDDAPLKLVLERIAGADGVQVVVGDNVEGLVDGRLDGTRETVLATLAVEHELSVHAVDDTVWFDPADEPVESLVPLDAADTARAFAALDSAHPDGSVVEGTDEGLYLSGPRSFVEGARRRIVALSESTSPSATVTERKPVRSISDVPGFDVDYRGGSSS